MGQCSNLQSALGRLSICVSLLVLPNACIAAMTTTFALHARVLSTIQSLSQGLHPFCLPPYLSGAAGRAEQRSAECGCRNVVSYSDGALGNSTGRLIFFMTAFDVTAADVEVKCAPCCAADYACSNNSVDWVPAWQVDSRITLSVAEAQIPGACPQTDPEVNQPTPFMMLFGPYDIPSLCVCMHLATCLICI